MALSSNNAQSGFCRLRCCWCRLQHHMPHSVAITVNSSDFFLASLHTVTVITCNAFSLLWCRMRCYRCVNCLHFISIKATASIYNDRNAINLLWQLICFFIFAEKETVKTVDALKIGESVVVCVLCCLARHCRREFNFIRAKEHHRLDELNDFAVFFLRRFVGNIMPLIGHIQFFFRCLKCLSLFTAIFIDLFFKFSISK